MGTLNWTPYLLSHEVRHLKHIENAGFLANYIGKFGWMYLINFIKEGNFNVGHDKVPEEKEATLKSMKFLKFNTFVTTTLKYKGGISALIDNSETTDSQKIKTIDLWWNQFNKQYKGPIFKKEKR